MEITYVNPTGNLIFGLVLLVAIGLFVLFKFVIKFRSDMFSAFYWTEIKFEQGPGVTILLLEDRLRVEMSPLSEKSSFEILYMAIDAHGREPADIVSSTVFIVTKEVTYYFAANRSRQLVQELSRRIDAYAYKATGQKKSGSVS